MALNGYAVYLTDNTTKSKIELPVNPAEVKLKYETDDKSENVINLGEVNTVGNLKLVELEISSAFPKRKMPYVSSKKFWKPDTYIKKIKNIQKKKHKVRVVIAGTKISILMTIQSFEYKQTSGNRDEYLYTISFKQYRSFKYKKMKKARSKSHKKKHRATPPKKIGIGSTVRVNGRLHLDSYGRAPGMYEKNAKRQVLYIVPGRKYPVCVGINGIARGWVKKSEVKRV